MNDVEGVCGLTTQADFYSANPWRGAGVSGFEPSGLSVNVDAPLALLKLCPVAKVTPLEACPA